jgi:site-specific recombinase XerD
MRGVHAERLSALCACIAARHGGDPAGLDEAQVREHLLHLKEAHHYSPSSMRTAVSALSGYYNQHHGRAWKLFDLVSSPSAQTLPQVLTREEVARLFAVIRTPRFLTVQRWIFPLEVRQPWPCAHLNNGRRKKEERQCV